MVAHPLRAIAPIPLSGDSNDPYLYTVDVLRDGARSSALNGRTSGIFVTR